MQLDYFDEGFLKEPGLLKKIHGQARTSKI